MAWIDQTIIHWLSKDEEASFDIDLEIVKIYEYQWDLNHTDADSVSALVSHFEGMGYGVFYLRRGAASLFYPSTAVSWREKWEDHNWNF